MCHIPTLLHFDIFPPGGNMAGGKMLVGHFDDLDPFDDDDYDGYDDHDYDEYDYDDHDHD